MLLNHDMRDRACSLAQAIYSVFSCGGDFRPVHVALLNIAKRVQGDVLMEKKHHGFICFQNLLANLYEFVRDLLYKDC